MFNVESGYPCSRCGVRASVDCRHRPAETPADNSPFLNRAKGFGEVKRDWTALLARQKAL